MLFRHASIGDLDSVMVVLDSARDSQRARGFVQWADGYPSPELIRADIESGFAFVAVDEDVIVGYAVLFGGDAEYDRMDLWQTPLPYSVVHRLAVSSACQGHGAGHRMLAHLENEARRRGFVSMRIDTGTQNAVMHRLLQAAGYVCRGRCDFVWGERLVFEREL